MEAQVVYSTRTGNTRKLAERIARELGAEAERASPGTRLSAPLVFLGSGVYGGELDPEVRRLALKAAGEARVVAPFATFWCRFDGFHSLRRAVEGAGGRCLEGFACKGRFLFLLNRGRPDESDLEAAARFAREAVEEASKKAAHGDGKAEQGEGGRS